MLQLKRGKMNKGKFYRQWVGTDDLVSFNVVVDQTDLFVRAERVLPNEVRDSVIKHRGVIQEYIHRRPEFQSSLTPIESAATAPAIIKDMLSAASQSGVGPMAGIAGVIAEYVGKDILQYSNEVIVENGGDIFLKTDLERTLGIFASDSAFTKRLGLRIYPQHTPLGVCASSGTFGHSLSFGRADAAIVVSKNTTLADCVATKVGNAVKTTDDITEGINAAKSIEGVLGVVIIIGDKLGSWGEIELIRI